MGYLNSLRIWHDNSGEGDYASWYLKFIIVQDLQTRQKFYFLCEKWLAVEKSDGKIDRILPIATDVQKRDFNYMAQKQIKQSVRDGHLWLSIFTRPTQSSFTRLDRVTCCFVLLFTSMLMNILYYGVDTSPSTGGLDIGPLSITPQDVKRLLI